MRAFSFVKNWLLIAQHCNAMIHPPRRLVSQSRLGIQLFYCFKLGETRSSDMEPLRQKELDELEKKVRIEEPSTHSTFSRLCTRLLVDCVADCFVLLPFSNFVFLDLSHLKYPNPRFKECDKETQYMSRVRYNKMEVAEAVTALAVPTIMIFSMFYKTKTRFTEVALTHLWWAHLQTTPCVVAVRSLV